MEEDGGGRESVRRNLRKVRRRDRTRKSETERAGDSE